MLSSSHNWNDEYLSKAIVKNCDLFVYSNSGTKLYDKSNILSYRLSSRNSYVCEQIPTDDGTLELYGEVSIAKETILKIAYVMENDETTTCKVLAVNDCRFNKDKNTTTIALVSPFKLGYKASSYNQGYTLSEYTQLEALSNATGIRIPPLAKATQFSILHNDTYDYFYFSHLEQLPINSVVCVFEDDYVFEDNSYNYSTKVDTDRSNVIMLGYIEDGETKINDYTTSTSYISRLFYHSDQMVFVYYKPKWYDGSWHYDANSTAFSHKGLNAVYVDYNNTLHPTATHIGVEVYGYALELEDSSGLSIPYIVTPLKQAETMDNEQARIRRYLKYNKLHTYKGRLDPRFEPLDIINVEAFEDINYLAIEQVDVEFNGAYNVTIVGRVANGLIFKPEVLAKKTSNPWIIRIGNPNFETRTLKIYYSGGTLTFSVAGNQTITLTNSTAGDLYESVVAYRNGTLVNSVYCNFDEETDNVIILEANA